MGPTAVPQLVLRREEHALVTIPLGQGELRQAVANIAPGRYRLELDMGRLLWEAQLTREDLIWSAAFPGKALPLAADTGQYASAPTRQESLAGRKLIIRVLPGIEAGCIKIEGQL